jgi:hypothetical protein
MKIKSNNDYQGMYDSFFVCKCVKLKWYETLLKIFNGIEKFSFGGCGSVHVICNLVKHETV